VCVRNAKPLVSFVTTTDDDGFLFNNRVGCGGRLDTRDSSGKVRDKQKTAVGTGVRLSGVRFFFFHDAARGTMRVYLFLSLSLELYMCAAVQGYEYRKCIFRITNVNEAVPHCACVCVLNMHFFFFEQKALVVKAAAFHL